LGFYTLACSKWGFFLAGNLLSPEKTDVHFDIEWLKAIPLKKRLYQAVKELARTINSGLTSVAVAS